ncbi:alpha/beta hydrolase [Leucobacter sp. W1153]|uniref:alpha/beta hydrolase n=1 Tax=Leucobacter sp. W1153 TaxID=3439064 RepID=UPI003F34EB21
MSGVWINDDLVRWSIGGATASREEAVAALSERPLLLLMHGYGSFEGDLIELAPKLPGAFVCASPRAPLTAPPPVVNGFAWFPISFGADGTPVPEAPPADFADTAPHVAALAMLQWLDELDAQVSGGLGTQALMGFSQGGAMVTSMLRLQPERFACGVNCSGFVVPGGFSGDAHLAEVRPPVFWGRDAADPIISADRIAFTAEWLPAHTEVEARLYPGIAHGISVNEVADISVFLSRHVALPGERMA